MSSSLGKPCSTNRNWTIIQFYCAALCVLLVTKGSHSAECYVSVTRCPCSMDLWNERAQNKSCGQPRNYACVLHESNILVEICTTNFTILNGTHGCPYVKRCKGKEAEFGISLRYKECPENIEGCPTKNHSEYSIYQLYQYPACFITNRTELKKETLQNYCTEEQPAGSKTKLPTEKSNSDWMILGPILATILAILVAIGLCVGKRIYNRRRKRNSESSKNKEEETPLNGNCESEKESSADTEEETSFHETRVKREDFQKLKDKLLKINENEVKSDFKFNPLTRRNVSSYFASVSLTEDIDYFDIDTLIDDVYTEKAEPKVIKTPKDIFEKDNLRHVFLRGDAGSGKTTFCLRLLDFWCKAHMNQGDYTDAEGETWIDGLRKFDCAFFICLDKAKEEQSILKIICNETDFVLYNTLHKEIQKVISNESYRCLIILDGLDEWKPSENVLHSLTTRGIPNFDSMSNNIVLISSRPCKLDAISRFIRPSDRMINILGLNSKGVGAFFENVLVSYYTGKSKNLKKEYDTFRRVFPDCSNPLLLTAAVDVTRSKAAAALNDTELYLRLVQFLIYRCKTERSHSIASVETDLQEVKMTTEITKIVQQHKPLEPYMMDLIRLGELAFDHLASDLLFEETVLSEKIGDRAYQFALKVGLLRRDQASPKDATKIRYNFMHRNIQELLAGLFMVSKYPSSLEELSGIEKIFELSYVITFISGLNPAMGAAISEHIAEKANLDKNIEKYRKTVDYKMHHIINRLYGLLEDCYKEAEKSKKANSLNYCVADIYLRSDYKCDMNAAKKLMDGNESTKSLYLRRISNDEGGISDSFLTEFLQNNPQLETFYIKGKGGDRSFDAANIFNIAQKRALVLDNVTITADTLGDIRYIDRAHQLETLGLWNVTFHDSIQSPPSSMKDLLIALPLLPKLSTLYISCKMYKEDREELIRTLPKLEHLTNIQYGGVSDEEEIYDNDTDNRVVKRILESRANTLKRLWLDYIKLDIDSLEPIKNMNCLEKVVLRRVHMEEDPWIKTIKNIENTQRQVSVSLVCTNITETVKFTVKNSDKFKLDLDNTLHYENMDKFTFRRVLN